MATFVRILDGSAESFEDAVGLVRGNPHLSLMDGNSIDLSECADLP